MDLFSVNTAHASLDSFIQNVNNTIINPVIVFLFALALALFLYGVLKFFLNPDSEEVKTDAKQSMLWGIVGFTIMIGVFAIMNIIMRTFDIEGINVNESTGEIKVDLPEYKP